MCISFWLLAQVCDRCGIEETVVTVELGHFNIHKPLGN